MAEEGAESNGKKGFGRNRGTHGTPRCRRRPLRCPSWPSRRTQRPGEREAGRAAGKPLQPYKLTWLFIIFLSAIAC